MGNCLSCLSHGNELKGKETIGGTARTKQNGERKKSYKKPANYDPSSNSSSNSSDSDICSGTIHKSRKTQSKNGTTMVVSNTTTVGGDIINIKGDGTVVNLGDRSARPKKRKERPHETERGQPRFHFSKKMRRNYETPNMPGCFLQIEDRRVTVLDQQTLLAVAKSVGKICAINYCATCFRVGSKYVMTANHVVMEIVNNGLINLGPTTTSEFAALESNDVYVDFGFVSTTNVGAAENIFYLTSNVAFRDEDLDIAVIELRSGQEYPPPFLNFSRATSRTKFTFVGHPFGEPKQLNGVDGLLQIDEQKKRQAVEWSRSVAGNDGFEGIDIPERILFHCSFQKGGSGSPGIAVVGGQAVVVTVLLHGYPDWYYNPNFDHIIKNIVGNQQRVEQGVDMKSLYFKMHSVDRDLCYAIFGANP